VIPRPTTATVALRSRAPTIRRPHTRIQLRRRRERIPRRAAATQLRHTPTPHRATAIAVAAAPVAVEARTAQEEVVAAEARTAQEAVEGRAMAVVAGAEVHTVAEGPVLTATANLLANSTARPDLPGGPFSLTVSYKQNFRGLASHLLPVARGITPTQLFGPFGVR
jgi:hypothetical protein